MDQRPFWQVKSLAEMSPEEWESLCDGCAKCCMVSLRDEATAEVFTTRLSCRLLDRDACRCRDYPNRFGRVKDCLQMTPRRAASLEWLPSTCAYRLIARGKPLPDWHPLVSGDPLSVHAAGVSVRGFAISEDDVDEDDAEEFIAALPGEDLNP